MGSEDVFAVAEAEEAADRRGGEAEKGELEAEGVGFAFHVVELTRVGEVEKVRGWEVEKMRDQKQKAPALRSLSLSSSLHSPPLTLSSSPSLTLSLSHPLTLSHTVVCAPTVATNYPYHPREVPTGERRAGWQTEASAESRLGLRVAAVLATREDRLPVQYNQTEATH